MKLSIILAIAVSTYRECVRSRILYVVLAFAALLVLLAAFFGTVTIGDQVKVIKDFGLLSISLFSALFAVTSGASLLYKELNRRTIYNILGKAVRRSEFILGKFFGLATTAVLLVVIMFMGLMGFTALISRQFDPLLIFACLHQICELLIVCAAAIFFSSIVVTPLLSGLFTFGIFLAGRSVEQLYALTPLTNQTSGLTSPVELLTYLLPRLDRINIANEVVYGVYPPPLQLMWSALYAASYSVVLLVLAALSFERREFN